MRRTKKWTIFLNSNVVIHQNKETELNNWMFTYEGKLEQICKLNEFNKIEGVIEQKICKTKLWTILCFLNQNVNWMKTVNSFECVRDASRFVISFFWRCMFVQWKLFYKFIEINSAATSFVHLIVHSFYAHKHIRPDTSNCSNGVSRKLSFYWNKRDKKNRIYI